MCLATANRIYQKDIISSLLAASDIEYLFHLFVFPLLNVGAGSRLLRPVVKFVQGKVETVNEALYPSL